MPLKRSKSLAVTGSPESTKLSTISTLSPNNDWTSLAVLTSLPRAHFTRRKHPEYHNNNNNDNKKKNNKHNNYHEESTTISNHNHELPHSSSTKTTSTRNNNHLNHELPPPTKTTKIRNNHHNHHNHELPPLTKTISTRHNHHHHHNRELPLPPPPPTKATNTRSSSNHHKNHNYNHRQQQDSPLPTTTTRSTPGRHAASFRLSSREVHMKALNDLQTAASRLPHPEVVYGAMIPDPDYSDEERDTNKPTATTMVERNNQVNSNDENQEQQKLQPEPGQGGRMDGRGLIMPKKLVNPCLESSDKKNLHRELMFNQKRGVNLLNQKSELQKAMEKHNDKKVLKEQEKEKQASLTPFQKALDERAHKIEQMEKAENKDEINDKTPPSCEFEKIHAKLRAKMEVQ